MDVKGEVLLQLFKKAS